MQGSPPTSGSPLKEFFARSAEQQSSFHKAGHYQVSFNDLNSLVEDDVAEEEMHMSFSPGTLGTQSKSTPKYFEAVEIDTTEPKPAWEGRIAGGGSSTAVPLVRMSNKLTAGPVLEKYRPPPGHYTAASNDLRKTFLYDSVDKEHQPSSVWEHILRSTQHNARQGAEHDSPADATAATADHSSSAAEPTSGVGMMKAASAPPAAAAFGGRRTAHETGKHHTDDDRDGDNTGMGGAGGSSFRYSDAGSNVSSSSNIDGVSARMSLDLPSAAHGDYGGHAFNSHVPNSNAFDENRKVDPAALTALQVAFGDTLGDSAAVLTQLAPAPPPARTHPVRPASNVVVSEAAAVAAAVDAVEAALDAGFGGEGGYFGGSGDGGRYTAGGGNGGYFSGIGPRGVGAGGGGYGAGGTPLAPPPPVAVPATVSSADSHDTPWESFVHGWWDNDRSSSKAGTAAEGGANEKEKERGMGFSPMAGMGSGFAAADAIAAERRRISENVMNFMSHPAG